MNTQTMQFKVTYSDGDERYVIVHDQSSINQALLLVAAQAVTLAADAVEVAKIEFWVAGPDAEHYPYGSAQAEAELLAAEERGYEDELRGAPMFEAIGFLPNFDPDDIPF